MIEWFFNFVFIVVVGGAITVGFGWLLGMGRTRR